MIGVCPDVGNTTLDYITLAVILLGLGGGALMLLIQSWMLERLEDIECQYNYIHYQLGSIIRKEDKQMASLQDFKDSVAAAREDLANIAADEARQTALIAELQGQIDSGGMTAEEETAALAEIKALKDELKAAADAIPE